MSRWLKFGKRFGYFGLALGAGYLFDSRNDEIVIRNLRTFSAAAQIFMDYKVFFDPEKVDELHTRAAKRILNVCQKNGGLYVKLGQGIASMNHVLPPQYNQIFSVLQDGAPSVGYEAVEKIFLEEFGKKPEDMFSEFSKEPIASASIAQVHKAKLKNGTPVAVKIQKPYIRKQMNIDLATYKIIVYLFEKAFDLPMYWATEYTDMNLRKEADFINEGKNSERAMAGLQMKDVYIPKVYWDTTSSRILTCEWIDGVKISDEAALKKMGLSVPSIIDTMVKIFAKQIFVLGFVHCDPHPGNILVRKRGNQHQLVLLDHGLYIEEPSKFRTEYCDLWKSIVLTDLPKLKSICESWGIRDSEMFASMQLMKPYNPNKAVHLETTTKQDIARMQREAKEKVKHLLQDTQLIPRELLFIGRNMNLVRANNKQMGSPVNRVNIMAAYAAQGLATSTGSGFKSRYDVFSFQFRLWSIGVFYHLTQFWRSINSLVGRDVGGFEDALEAGMKQTLEDQLGLRMSVDEKHFSKL